MNKNVILIPFDSGRNPYCELIRNELKIRNFNIIRISFLNILLLRYDRVIFNWADILISSRPLLAIPISFLLLWSKIFNKKIIYITHNRNKKIDLSKLRDIYIYLYNMVINFTSNLNLCHGCIYSADNKLLFAPHPLYNLKHSQLNSVESALLGSIEDFFSYNKFYLIFGAIVKYKKLELLLNRLPKLTPVLIIGEVHSNYDTELGKLNHDLKLLIVNHKPSETMLDKIIAISNAVLIPPHDDIAIISGNYMKAVSCGTTPIFSSKKMQDEVRCYPYFSSTISDFNFDQPPPRNAKQVNLQNEFHDKFFDYLSS